MTGEEDELEIVQINEKSTNVVRGKVTGTVMQFDTIDGDIGNGLVIRGRQSPEND